MQSAHERKFHQRDGFGQWGVRQVRLTGRPSEGNPFRDARLRAEFHGPGGRPSRCRSSRSTTSCG
ncbi:MAG TPA: hypothetical protein VGL23_00700 [Chloroflexota bacterium]